MASLYNNKISATYVGLIKTLDSAVINATLRELSDGLGNQTGLFINTSGDFKATGILEFGSLKDTGENITITKFVDEADGIANNDNDTTIPTSAAIIDYVASQVTLEDLDFSGDSGSGSVDLDSQTFAIVGTSNEIETSASGQQLQVGIVDNPTITGIITSDGLDVGDNEKIRLGTGNDLEIYHNGTNSYISNDTGNFEITTTGSLILQDASSNKWLMTNQSGNVLLYSAGSVKLNTKSTGVDITGDLYATGTLEVTSTGQSSFAGQVTIPETPSANTDAASKGYVDSQVTAQDLDFGGDSGTGSVDLDSQSLSVTGTTNQVVTSATNQTLNISLPATVHRNLQGDVTGDLTGNVTATSVLADGVTATTQTDGDNSTKVATTAYVDTAIQGHDTLAEVLTGGNTTGGTDIAVSAGDDITFTDTSKAIFGAGSDLQIYHEGTDSYIKDAGTGNLNINADQLVFKSADNTETKAVFNTNGQVELYHDNSKKLETVSNGVDITGNADISGQITVGTSDTLLAENTLRFKSSGDAFIDQNVVGQSLYLRTSNASSLDTNAVIIASDGDIDLSGSLTIAQDLTVNGTTTTVNTQTLAVEDPLISLAKDNAANSVDIGFYGRYNDGSNRYLGLYADASDTNTFKLFKGTTTEPTTTVDSTATGYTLADLDVNNLDASTITTGYQFIGDYIYHTGDNNTYLGFPSNDNFAVSTGGNTNLAISSSTVTLKHSGTTKLETSAGGINITGGADTQAVITGTTTAARLDIKTNSHHRFLQTIESDGKFRIFNQTTNTEQFSIASNNNATFGDGTGNLFVTIDAGNPIYFLKETDQSADNKIWGIQSETSLLKFRAFNDALSSATDVLTFTRTGNATFKSAVNIDGKLTLDAGSLTNGIINTPASLRINIDSNNNNTGEKFVIGHNQDSINNNNELFVVEENGDVTIETNGADDIKNFSIKGSNGSSQVADFVIQNDGANGYVHFKAGAGGSTPTTKFTLGNAANSGNFGIGEDTPVEILHTNKDSAGDVVGGYFTNSNANTGAEKVSLAFGLNRSGGDFVRQTKAITFGAEQQWTGTPSTVDGYLAFSTMQNETASEKVRISSGGNVDIGTNGAGARNARLLLQNAGSQGAPQLMLIDSGDSGKQSEIRFDSGDLIFDYWSGSSRSEKMRLTSSSNPTLRLGVSGTGTSIFEMKSAAGGSSVIDAEQYFQFKTGGTQRALITADGELKVGTTNGAAARVHIVSTAKDRKHMIEGNGNTQGTAEKITIVNHYPVVSSGSQLIIPFVSQGNLNSTTIMKVMGHSAKFNSSDPLGFTATIQVGHLQQLYSVSALDTTGNISGVSTSGMNLIISFTTAYTSSTADGIFVTIEYMSNTISYSIDVANIAMN